MKKRVIVLSAVLALSGCNAGQQANIESDRNQSLLEQVESLKSENARLVKENAELRETPVALLADVTEQIGRRDISSAEEALSKLVAKFPNSIEAEGASTSLENLKKEEQARAAEAARLAALGFKALKVSPKISNVDSTLNLRSSSISSRWTFDSYGDEWYYKESEKGERFITAKVTVSSESKDPKLMGLGAYVADGKRLRRIGSFEYRFARWDDYASYLGNEADYRNDFAHSSAIPFSVAAKVPTEDMKKPIYLIATKEGCFTRSSDRFRNPPVWYYSSSCPSLAATLTIENFSDDKLVVLKRLD